MCHSLDPAGSGLKQKTLNKIKWLIYHLPGTQPLELEALGLSGICE